MPTLLSSNKKKRLLCSQVPRPDLSTFLSESEAYHATRVLRLGDGDRVQVIDGKGHTCWAFLRTSGMDGRVRLEFVELVEDGSSEAGVQRVELVPLVLEAAVLKGPAMDWLIEKAVELGVSELAPLLTVRSVVKMERKSPGEFVERWKKIADQSLKQCGRLHQMKIREPRALESGLSVTPSGSIRFWCDEEQEGNGLSLLAQTQKVIQAGKSIIHLSIGPEGGWDHRERQILSQQAVRVSLGPLVMRAETASIFGASVVSALLREVQAKGSKE